jgi:regulator of protease activity HflC (stomatin/prohibitin superfamily)
VAESAENVITKHTILAIMNDRQTVSKEIEQAIIDKFSVNNYIIVSDLILTDIDFPDEVEKSLKARIIANQQEESEKIKTKIIQEQVKQQIEQAKGEAESLKIKNEALKGNKDIIKLNFIEKWNGVLPTTISGSNEIIKMIQ